MGFYKKNEYLRQAGNTRKAMAQIAMDGARRVSQQNNKVAEAIAQGLNSVGRVASSYAQGVEDAEAMARAEARKMDNIRKGLQAIGAKEEILNAVNQDGMTSDVAQNILNIATDPKNIAKTSYNQGINTQNDNLLTGKKEVFGDSGLFRYRLGGGDNKRYYTVIPSAQSSILTLDPELTNHLMEKGLVRIQGNNYETWDMEQFNKASSEFITNRNNAKNPTPNTNIDPEKIKKFASDYNKNPKDVFFKVLSGTYKF